MWETKLEFLRPGLHTLIQDIGREGAQSFGVPKGGVMDTRSMMIGNRLVGNSDNTPVLEISLLGPKIKVIGDAYLAITGANIEVIINEKKAAQYETLHAPSGSIIDLGAITHGTRSYLAINGIWSINRWLDSCSPLPILNLERLAKNQINKSNKLVINTQKLISKKTCPSHIRPKFADEYTIRIIRGPEYDLMSLPNQKYFSATNFTIHKNSNRMAVSMVESIPNFKLKKEMISSANLIGTIQLTSHGQPLILMNDGGTAGGYPRVANVISADLSKIAQLQAGQKIKFQLVDIDFAINELKKEKELLHSIL